MNYKYHCQNQAEDFARAIIDVPENYPLIKGLSQDYPKNFSKLCKLAKEIYLDMAKKPESYGLKLVDIESNDHNLARDGYRTIHRFVDTLANLSNCGTLDNHHLSVKLEEFKKASKKGFGLVSGPVPKYELIFSRLVDFGFVISDFDGNAFAKAVQVLTIYYPDYPLLIDTIKSYIDCWNTLRADKSSVKIWPKEFHHHYYRFDYKITSDLEKIPMQQWISDEAGYLGYSSKQKEFSRAFYEYSRHYNLQFDGDYNYKGKRIARIYQAGYSIGEKILLVQVRIKNIDNYMNEIETMPENIKKELRKDSCRLCNFQSATKEHCKFRIHWNFANKDYTGCSHATFYFDDFSLEMIPYYFRLLELEYDLKQ